MNRFLFQTNLITNYDLLTKINYKNTSQFLKLDKIVLNIGLKRVEKKDIIPIILLLEIISNQKGKITKSTKNKILLKIKKGSIVGCKITLLKKNMFNFFEKILIFCFPKIKNFSGIKVKHTFTSFKIFNLFDIFELTTEYLKFFKILNINVTLCPINVKKEEQIRVLLNSYNFPISK